jgi:ketosteroid isomerase-like protein
MREGNIDAVIDLYDPEAILVTEMGDVKSGRGAIREQLAPFAAARAEFFFMIKDSIQTGNIALTHNIWAVDVPRPASGWALEVCRRQPDGSWRCLISDPFTVGGRTMAGEEAVPEEVPA